MNDGGYRRGDQALAQALQSGPGIADLEGQTPVAVGEDGVVLTVSGDKMSWLERAFYDVGHFLGIGDDARPPDADLTYTFVKGNEARQRAERWATYNWPAAQQYQQRAESMPGYRPTVSDQQVWTTAMRQAGSQVNREVGGFLAVTAGGAAVVAAAAPSLVTFALTNAVRISTASGIAGEIITGVPLTVPVATGTGIAIVNAAERVGGRFATEAQIVAGIERNADIAVELMRRQAARGLVTNSEQAFGSRSHLLFDKLNTRLGRELRLDGSDFRLQSEVFRDSSLLTGARNAPGSIGADAFLTHRVDPFYSRVFDLKTYGTTQIPISPTRQSLFQTRFGAQAEELYRAR